MPEKGLKHVLVCIQAAAASKHFYTCNDADQAACFELQNPNMTSIRLLNCKPCRKTGKILKRSDDGVQHWVVQ
jgi:hypothetical protein